MLATVFFAAYTTDGSPVKCHRVHLNYLLDTIKTLKRPIPTFSSVYSGNRLCSVMVPTCR